MNRTVPKEFTIAGFGVLSALIGLLLLSGCSSLQTQQRLARVVSTSVEYGTMLHLRHNPQDRPQFETALGTLNKIIDDGSFDPLAFAEVIRKLPIKELKGSDADIYVQLGLVALDELVTDISGVTSKPQVQILVTRARDALSRALARTPPPPK